MVFLPERQGTNETNDDLHLSHMYEGRLFSGGVARAAGPLPRCDAPLVAVHAREPSGVDGERELRPRDL